MNLATAISDGVLAICAAAGTVALFRARASSRDAGQQQALVSAAVGLALIGLAAAVGSVRYGLAPGLGDVHALLSRLAGHFGMPLIGAGYVAVAWSLRASRGAWLALYVALGVLPFVCDALGLGGVYILVIGSLGVLAILAAAARQRAAQPVAAMTAAGGAVLVLIAGLVIGTKGHIGPIARVDAFHYTLAIAALLKARGLQQLSR